MHPRLSTFCCVPLVALTVVATACEPSAGRSAAAGKLERVSGQYATVRLDADLTQLSDKERAILPLLIEAAQQIDDLFWVQAFGNRDSLLARLTDPTLRRYVEVNYGPWDRLRGDSAFVPGVGSKAPGANFYPPDMTREDFETYVSAHPDQAQALKDLYTLVRRGPDESLHAIQYSYAFADRLGVAARKLREAAALAEDAGLARYLRLRADALLDDRFRASDLAWMEMRDNTLDIVIGPIETYEDQLFGYKASYEAFVLIKDQAWSERLVRYAGLLPGLQRELPVPDDYRREIPGSEAQLNAYDAVYFAGEANAGAKTIAINLPNDETVQLEKGTRRLQLKNAMRAKFDSILVPIAARLIAADQRTHVTFDAFFANTMFHEVAHGLGIKNTINRRESVREALRETASAMEEGKADILGLWMITRLRETGEITEGDIRDNYVTYLASILRSVRFGASDAHGRANMVQFNFFDEQGVFTRDSATGTYRVDFDRMPDAVRELSALILRFQGDGDYQGSRQLLDESGVIGPALRNDLQHLAGAHIPVDIVFEQGVAVLRLGP